jgi:hypothetical protein
MTAHVTVHADTAPVSRVICAECTLDEPYARTAPAQAAAREHNRLRHAYPETTLEIPETR